jgi:hypothetical protein
MWDVGKLNFEGLELGGVSGGVSEGEIDPLKRFASFADPKP